MLALKAGDLRQATHLKQVLNTVVAAVGPWSRSLTCLRLRVCLGHALGGCPGSAFLESASSRGHGHISERSRELAIGPAKDPSNHDLSRPVRASK